MQRRECKERRLTQEARKQLLEELPPERGLAVAVTKGNTSVCRGQRVKNMEGVGGLKLLPHTLSSATIRLNMIMHVTV